MIIFAVIPLRAELPIAARLSFRSIAVLRSLYCRILGDDKGHLILYCPFDEAHKVQQSECICPSRKQNRQSIITASVLQQ